jgi:hypothetical protein
VQNQTTSDSLRQLLEMPRKSWWARLPFGVRMAAGAGALLIAIGGGVAGIAALTRDGAKPRIVTAVGDAAVPDVATPEGSPPGPLLRNPVAVPARTSAEADRSGSRGRSMPDRRRRRSRAR